MEIGNECDSESPSVQDLQRVVQRSFASVIFSLSGNGMQALQLAEQIRALLAMVEHSSDSGPVPASFTATVNSSGARDIMYSTALTGPG